MKTIPLHSLVVTVGPSGAGKSTLVNSKFAPHEIVSLDKIREFLTGDSDRQDVYWQMAKEVNHRINLKLSMGERVVVDGTYLQKKHRLAVADIAKIYGVPLFYLIVNRPLQDKLETKGSRLTHVIEDMEEQFISAERDIKQGDYVASVIDTRREDFGIINKLPKGDISAEVKARGYDGIITFSDVHGERESLKSAIDWAVARNLFIVLLGDYVDYGPHSIECFQIVYDLVIRGKAIALIGNHERKIFRWIEQSRKGNVTLRLSEGNLVTTKAIEAMNHNERRKTENQFVALWHLSRHHILFDKFILAHAAVKPELIDNSRSHLAGEQEKFAIFGQVDSVNPFTDGYPNRVYDWTNDIPTGYTAIVGHDIRSYEIPLEVRNEQGGKTIFLDTGSGKGGKLSAAHIKLKNDEYEIVAYSGH